MISRPEGAVIIDFKATQVKNQKEADKRTADSLQMDLYALSFIRTQDGPLLGTELYFLESDLVGHAAKGEREIERAWSKVREAEEGIRNQRFRPPRLSQLQALRIQDDLSKDICLLMGSLHGGGAINRWAAKRA